MSNFEVFPPKCEDLLLDTDQCYCSKGRSRKMFSINQQGRNYQKGVPLSSDLRNQVKELAQDYSFSEVGRRLRISKGAVSKIVKQYIVTGSTAPKQSNHVRTVPRCTFQDSILLETMVQASVSSSLKELRDDLAIHGDCGELSTSTISRNIRYKLPSGRNYSRKRLGKCASERFTPENIVYTQLYIDYLKDKDPSSVKFFDESGFQLPDAGHRNFGFSPVGEDCVEARRYLSTANLTLNFLVGYDGVKYGNIIEGASNSVQFLRFFDEASQTVDPITQRPILEVGDIVVVDNLAAHHGEAERALRSFLNDLGMELVFLPVYSPDLNPVEEVFSKLKYLLKYRYQELVWDNLEYAVLRAVGDVTAADMYGYYKHVGYLF